jgi:uncharacterized membrane protein YadS
MKSMTDTLRDAMPGLLLSATIALAVRFVSDHLGGPAMLYALLFGMAFNFLTEDERFARGIRFASRHILRIGVALLGIRITTAEVMELGWQALALVVAAVLATVLVGGLIGRIGGLKGDQSILSAGAVAICGASAALAIASVLPSHKRSARSPWSFIRCSFRTSDTTTSQPAFFSVQLFMMSRRWLARVTSSPTRRVRSPRS